MTPAMSLCLRAIKDLTKGDVSPSYAEIQAHIGLTSRSQVNRLVVALRDRGFVDFEPNCARSIRIIEPVAPGGIPLTEMSETQLQTLKRQVDMVLAERRLNARRPMAGRAV